MKRFSLALLLCLALSQIFIFSAWAATVTISSTTVNPGTAYPGSTCTLRIYSSITFTAADGTTVMAGTPGTGAFFKSVNCAISGGVIAIPSFTIPSTTDALDNQTAKYTAVFYDSKGVKRDTFLQDFPIPTTLGSPITWAQIRVYKAGVQPLRDVSVYTKQQTDAQIAAAITGTNAPKATDVIAGITKLTIPAANSANPIARGANDRAEVDVDPNGPCVQGDEGTHNGIDYFCATTNNWAQRNNASVSINPGQVSRIPKIILTPTYTVLQSDGGQPLVFVNAGAVAVTLAQAGTSFATPGFWFDVSVQGGGTVTITSPGSTINGQPTLVLASGASAERVSNTGGNWYAGLGGSVPTPASTVVSPDDYGAIHDGSSHLLSSRYSTLAAAQAAYNGAYRFVTSLSQEIDYAALKASLNAGLGGDSAPGSYITVDKTSTVSVIVDPTASYVVNALAGQVLLLRYYNGFIAQEPIASNTATTITLSIPLPFEFHCGSEVCLTTCGAPPQTFDCIQYAISVAGEHGYDNRKLNKPVYWPGGSYRIGADTLLIRNAVGAHIYGAGRYSTTITGSGVVFQTDGLWYSHIEGITFSKSTTAVGPVVDIDGNVPGHPYTTRTVQGNTFTDISVSGASGTAAGTVGVWQCRLGGSSAQCENLWINPYVSSAEIAFINNGFNALANKIVRGDMQDFITGVYSVAGWVNIDGTSFESTHPYEQATQGGFDVHIGEAGNFDRMLLAGIRTESLQFLKGSSAQPATAQNVVQQFGAGFTVWSAAGNYTLHQMIIKPVIADASRNHAFYVKVAGTSGAVQPVWTASGDILDGTLTWTEIPFFSVDTTTISGGQQPDTLTLVNSRFAGPTSIGGLAGNNPIISALTATLSQKLIDWQYTSIHYNVDATGGNINYTINTAPIGAILSAKRVDSSGNTVSILPGTATIDGSGSTITVPSQGAITLVCTATNVWKIVAKNWGNDAATLNGASFAAPGAIGGTTPATGTFTALTSTSLTVTGTPVSTSSVGLVGALQVMTTGGMTNAIIPSTTGYITPGNSGTSSEVNRQLSMPACVVRNLRVNLNATSPAAGTVIITIRKNGVDTAITITVTAGTVASVVSDLTHTATFAAGDLLSISITNNDAANNFVLGSSITFEIVPT